MEIFDVVVAENGLMNWLQEPKIAKRLGLAKIEISLQKSFVWKKERVTRQITTLICDTDKKQMGHPLSRA